MLTRISNKEIGLLEWESATLDMSFVDDYKDEVAALLQAQLEHCQKEHKEKVKELIQRVEEVAQQAPSLSLGDMINSVFWEGLKDTFGVERQ